MTGPRLVQAPGKAVAAPPRPAAAPDRRTRRKAATRARLLRAARALFVERGYDATRPQDIARRADLAVGTFYLHFADKGDAFRAFTEEAARELMEALRRGSAGAGGFAEGLRASLEALLAFADAQPGVLSACFADATVLSARLPRGESLRGRLTASLAQGLRQGMARGELHRDYDAELVAAAIVGLVQHALLHGRDEACRAAVLENVTRFCARALLAPPGAPQRGREGA